MADDDRRLMAKRLCRHLHGSGHAVPFCDAAGQAVLVITATDDGEKES